MSVQAGWHPDPTGRHRLRYQDDFGWTAWVADDAGEMIDPEGAPTEATVWLSPPPDARDAGVQQAGRKTIAWIVGSVGAVITASVLFSGYGVLALGVGLIASVVAVRAMIGADDPSLRLLRVLVPLLLLGGAIFCATATKTYQPDPFGLAVGSDVHVHCGSVLRPRDDDYGCENWRNARAVEAKWLLVLAVVVAAAAAIDWLIARHRSRNAPANQDDPR